jgi:adenine-specific DNA methylase
LEGAVTQRRLIEEELPLQVVNKESAREKSLRHGHISTMHLWWARRPLAMSRAVVFGTLLPDPGDPLRRKEILDLLAAASPFEASVREDKIRPLRELLAEAYPDGPPKVLDCFAGGGAIPLEALRLGCDVTAVDLNPVAHLIEKCVLEYPQRFGQTDDLGRNTLAEDFMYWAEWVRKRVEPKLAKVFPADEHGRRPAVYFWARTMRCPNPSCRAEIPLLSSFWLANSTRRTVWVKVTGEPGRVDLEICSGSPPKDRDLSIGTVKASSVTCPGCGTATRAQDVRGAEAALQDSARRLGAGKEKHMSVILADLSTVFVLQDDPEQACAVLHQVVDLVELTGSAAGKRRAFAAGRQLTGWRNEAFVQEVQDRLLALAS